MNTDIRLLLSFRNHPKTKKLRLKLGDAGPLGFIYLLMFVAESKPDGILDGMDEDDIALAADYRGDPDEFVETLVAVRLLDRVEGGFGIHDWQDNNPWAAGAEARSEKARKAAEARHGRGRQGKTEKGNTKDSGQSYGNLGEFPSTENQTLTPKNHAPSTNEQSNEQDLAKQQAQSSIAPSPSPSPYPKPSPYPANTSNETSSPSDGDGAVLKVVRGERPDLSDWRPDEPTIDRIRLTDPDITAAFIERVRLEFITFAEDQRFRPDVMRSRFIKRCHAEWIKAKASERNTGPLRKNVPVDIAKMHIDALVAHAQSIGAPAPGVGESGDDYRARVGEFMRKAAGSVQVGLA